MGSEDNLFSFFILGKMLAKAEKDTELHKYLVTKSCELVFSESENCSDTNASFFAPFFATLNEESLITSLHEQMQSMVKLGEGKLSTVVSLVESISFKLSDKGA